MSSPMMVYPPINKGEESLGQLWPSLVEFLKNPHLRYICHYKMTYYTHLYNLCKRRTYTNTHTQSEELFYSITTFLKITTLSQIEKYPKSLNYDEMIKHLEIDLKPLIMTIWSISSIPISHWLSYNNIITLDKPGSCLDNKYLFRQYLRDCIEIPTRAIARCRIINEELIKKTWEPKGRLFAQFLDTEDI